MDFSQQCGDVNVLDLINLSFNFAKLEPFCVFVDEEAQSKDKCLGLLQELIHSSKSFEFKSLLLEHLDVIPDDFDKVIGKLKGAFVTNEAALRSRSLMSPRALDLLDLERWDYTEKVRKN